MTSTAKCGMCIHQEICINWIMSNETKRFEEAEKECTNFKPYCEYCKGYGKCDWQALGNKFCSKGNVKEV